jgi:type II secretory ATPase GspE/PulE/Tfp pilus assembly ATPase PilB-like protein
MVLPFCDPTQRFFMTQLPALIERTAAPRESGSESSPIVRIQRLIFSDAAALGASDIHIEPGRVCTRVRCRIDGVLRQTAELPRWMHENLVVRIKVMAHLDLAERRVPQDGHIAAEATGSDDARVSTIPTRWGEKIVLRLLKRARYALSLSQLGFPESFEERLRTWIRRSQGILFVVGPTGSGKTTTLYGLINELRDEPLNVVTIEDPIEYEVDGLTQIQIHEKAGLTFARALRAILRQDPDVILVGEIRDAETAKTAVHAAMTGHLVLSTLHATDSISSLSRLAELGIEHRVAAGVVLGVIAQRLVRLNCRACAEPDHPPPLYLDCLGIARSESGRCRRSPGCEDCRFTGNRGRAGMFELLDVTGPLRSICALGDESRLRQAALDAGLISLRQQAASLALAGAISVDEAYRFGYFGAES